MKHDTRTALLVVLVAALPAWNAQAAGRVRPDSKIDATVDPFPNYDTWLADDAGLLWRLKDGFDSSWVTYPETASYPVGPQGVAVADWIDTAGHQRVFYTNAAGTTVYEFRIDTDSPTRTLTPYAAPAGHTFTGHVEARSVLVPKRRIFLAATTTDNGGVVHFITCMKSPTETSCPGSSTCLRRERASMRPVTSPPACGQASAASTSSSSLRQVGSS